MKFWTNNLSFFIARTLQTKTKATLIITRVAVFSVVISVMVMIIAICIVSGFSKEIDSKVKGILSSYQIVGYDANLRDRGIPRNEELEKKILATGVIENVYAYATKAGLARNGEQMSGIQLKGVDDSLRLKFYEKYIVSGRLPQLSGDKRVKELLLSKNLANQLKVKSGDPLELLFFEDPPLRERFVVSGIYDTAIGTLDKVLIITDLRNVQSICEWEESQIEGYDVVSKESANNVDAYDQVADIVDRMSIPDDAALLMVTNIQDNYPQIYSWLELQKSNKYVILTIMMIVGIINIIAMVLILLLQNMYHIGVLTVLGMTKGAIRRLFIVRSLLVVFRAIVIGNAIAILLLFIQQQYKVIQLDAVGYSVDSVPVFFAWDEIVAMNLLIVVVMLLFQWITTLMISKMTPSKIVKYEKR